MSFEDRLVKRTTIHDLDSYYFLLWTSSTVYSLTLLYTYSCLQSNNMCRFIPLMGQTIGWLSLVLECSKVEKGLLELDFVSHQKLLNHQKLALEMTISLGVKVWAEHLTQLSYLKRSDVDVSLAGNDAVTYLGCGVCVCVCAHKYPSMRISPRK